MESRDFRPPPREAHHLPKFIQFYPTALGYGMIKVPLVLRDEADRGSEEINRERGIVERLRRFRRYVSPSFTGIYPAAEAARRAQLDQPVRYARSFRGHAR